MEDGARRFPACIMAAAVVPWTDDFEFHEPLFRRQVAMLLANGYTRLYVFGTAGEGYAVDDPQFEQVAGAFVDEMRRVGAEPMVGVINLSLPTILRRIAFARETLGVHQFQISLPSWGALESDEVRTFFESVLGRFEDCQFLHYNLIRAGRLVTAAEYAAVAHDHPNLVATKNTTDSMVRIRALMDGAPMLQHFLGEHGYLYGSLIGECGLLISLGAINFEMGRRYFEAGQKRDLDTLLRLECELSQIANVFEQCVGGGVTRIDGAYDKVLWHVHDPEFPLRLLPPYKGADSAAAGTFLDFLKDRFPHWTP
jgi:dihydrodipicolinate synthase/N-acetylneuraminate lyase